MSSKFCDKLVRAVQSGCLSAVKYYVSRTGSNGTPNDIIKKCQILAAENGNIEILKQLICGKGFEEASIVSAIVYGHVAVVEYLLEESKQSFGTIMVVAFNAAIECDHISILDYLLTQKYDLNVMFVYKSSIRRESHRMIDYFYSKGHLPSASEFQLILSNRKRLSKYFSNVQYMVNTGLSIDTHPEWWAPIHTSCLNLQFKEKIKILKYFLNYVNRKQRRDLYVKYDLYQNYKTSEHIFQKHNFEKFILKPNSMHMQLSSIE
jgi:hypothetical protein